MAHDGADGQENINSPLVIGFTADARPVGEPVAIWPSRIILSEDYFHNLMESMPSCWQSYLMALSGNVLVLDAYTFLAHRLQSYQPTSCRFGHGKAYTTNSAAIIRASLISAELHAHS
jgi:hypothetical protein